jgi:hypothetical protein
MDSSLLVHLLFHHRSIIFKEEIMNIGKSFSFVFEDKKWIEKVLIGGILMLIPILGPILMLGYNVELVRNVRKHDPEPLPAWDEWGKKIAEGFKLIIINIVWGIPLWILFFLMFIPMAITGDSDSGSAIAGFFSLCLSCFTILYAILFWFAIPGITIKFAETGEFGDGFKFGEIIDFAKKHIGQIIVVAIVSWLVYMVAGMIGMLLCGVGLLFTSFWASLVQYHMIANIGLEEMPARPLTPVPAAPSAPVQPAPPAEPAQLPEESDAAAPQDTDADQPAGEGNQ